MASASSAAELWAKTTLTNRGITVTGPLDPVRAMPWSQVSRYPTDRGYVYCKQMAPLFAHEPVLLAFLNQLPDLPVPRLIAHNPALHCFLMHDAGQPLRPILKERYDAAVVCRALQACAHIQQQVIPHTAALLAGGLADWRLARLPALLARVLDDEALMQAEAMTTEERAALHNALPRLEALCTELAACGIPETLEHGDFHDNNFMQQPDGTLTINDWGDASLSHPFFALASCLESACLNHAITPATPVYEQLQASYLDSWSAYASRAMHKLAFQRAMQIRPVQFAVNYSRLAQNVRCAPQDYYAGWIATRLRNYLRLTAKLD